MKLKFNTQETGPNSIHVSSTLLSPRRNRIVIPLKYVTNSYIHCMETAMSPETYFNTIPYPKDGTYNDKLKYNSNFVTILHIGEKLQIDWC